MSLAVISRKRSRAHLHEEDELSQAAAIEKTPLSNIKKRKLNTGGSSPADGTSFGSLKRKIGGLLWPNGKEKENLNGDGEEEEVDELAAEHTSASGKKKNGKSKKDVWDIPSSGAEEEKETQRTLKVTPKRAGGAQKNGSGKGVKAASSTSNMGEDIWDTPTESPKRSLKKITNSVERAKAILAPVLDESTPELPRKRGRPRKSDVLRQAKRLSKKATRESMMAATQHSTEDEDEDGLSPVKRRQSRNKNDELSAGPDEKAITEATSVRKRGRPRKQSIEHPQSAKLGPKSILTPSKNKPSGPRKSVAFNEDGEVDLGFKDLPSMKKVKRTKETNEELLDDPEAVDPSISSPLKENGREMEGISTTIDEIDSDDSDDVACGICSGLDSKKKNPIILCDSCEFAVHIDCYQIPKVPKGDWFCRNCEPSAETGASFTHLDDSALVEETPGNLPDIEGFEDHIRRFQRILLDKVTGQKGIKLQGHDEEMQKVHQVVEQTVLAGEGNSMLVIGARGSGKTTLVEAVISDISSEQRHNFHVVRLNGFIHTDDKLALKEIWRQLGREMDAEEDFAGRSNYADTLASLLALLSHPSELSESHSDQTAKSVIFILDEFDLFTTHPRQTLLYNLFDIAQARKAPIVVLGLTTRIDVVESLEKRVKSRFSHRYVHLSLPKSIPAFWDICKQGLLVDEDDLSSETMDHSRQGQDEFMGLWQTMIEDLYNKDAIFKHTIQSHFYRTKSVPSFFTSCILPLANLTPKTFPLTGKKFSSNTISLAAPDSKLQILQGLSELELALLIAAARLDIILDTDTCNFAMAYDEYSSLTSRHKIQTSSTGVAALGGSAKVWGRDVALGAWERLGEYGLLVPAGVGVGSSRDIGAGGRMWKADVGLEEISSSVDGLSTVMGKWCREI